MTQPTQSAKIDEAAFIQSIEAVKAKMGAYGCEDDELLKSEAKKIKIPSYQLERLAKLFPIINEYQFDLGKAIELVKLDQNKWGRVKNIVDRGGNPFAEQKPQSPKEAPKQKPQSPKVDRAVYTKAKPQSTLTEDHRNHVRLEGFSDEDIDLWRVDGLCSLTEQEAIALNVGCRTDSGKFESSSGLWFPEGNGQLRCDNPPIRNGKPAKYLTPCGVGAKAYIPDGCKVVTEGAKDGRAGTVLGGIPTGSVAGVSHYRKALPKDSKLTILFDSDGWTNPSVFTNLCHAATHTGGKVQLVPPIPDEPKAGLCEYFKAGYTARHYRELIDGAMSVPDFLFELPKHWDGLGEEKMSKCRKSLLSLAVQYLDEVGRDRLISHMSQLLKVGKRPLQNDLKKFVKKSQAKRRKDAKKAQQKEAQQKAKSASEVVDGMSFPQIVAAKLYTDDRWICTLGKLRRHTGTWYKESEDEVELIRIQELANNTCEWDKDGNPRFPHANPQAVKSALEWVKMQFAVPFEKCNPIGLNCTNGILQISYTGDLGNIAEFKLIPHTPDLYYLYEPMATYDPNAPTEDCDRMMDALDKPYQDILLKVISASLDISTIRKFHGRSIRALLLIGVGSNGKDAHREATSLMFGKNGMSSASFQDFAQYDEGRKFPLSKLTTSRINWASENKKGISLDDLPSLKQAITGEELYIELKSVDEKAFIPKSVQIFNLNDVPTLKAGMNAIDSRVAVIPYNKVYAAHPDPAKGQMQADPRFKDDPDFMKNYVLPAFLNRVIAAFTDFVKNGIDYSPCAEPMKEIQIQNSHLFEFVRDAGLILDRGATIPVKELWSALEQYYIDTEVLKIDSMGNRVWAEAVRPGDTYVKGSNQIAARLLKLFPQCKLVEVGHRQKGIKGLAFMPTAETIETEPAKVEAPDVELQDPESEQPEEAETLPSWVKLGNCFLNGTNTPIRIKAIERTSDGIVLIDPVGGKHKLSECRPEIIPASVQRGAT